MSLFDQAAFRQVRQSLAQRRPRDAELVSEPPLWRQCVAWRKKSRKDQVFELGDDSVGDDPWDGQTLEWTTTSPAPRDNFVDVPVVHSAEPLLDLKTASASHDGSNA